MQSRIQKTFVTGLAAGVAIALGGCASTAVREDTTRTQLIYSTGQAAAPRLQQPVAQVDLGPTSSLQGAGAGMLGIVYFDFDRYDIKPEYRPDLERHAQVLRSDASAAVVVEGHTDQFGSVEYNLALGNRRAEAVRRALTQLGVKENQLEAVSFGELKPAEPGEDAASRAKNRRAELRYAR